MVETRRAMKEALAAYETTGDHNHGKGPIPPGVFVGSLVILTYSNSD